MHKLKYFSVLVLIMSAIPLTAMRALKMKQEAVSGEYVTQDNSAQQGDTILIVTKHNRDMLRLSEIVNNFLQDLESNEISLSGERVSQDVLKKILNDMPKVLDMHRSIGINDYSGVRAISAEERKTRAEAWARKMPVPKYSSKALQDTIAAFIAADYLMIPELRELYGYDIAHMLFCSEGFEALINDISIMDRLPYSIAEMSKYFKDLRLTELCTIQQMHSVYSAKLSPLKNEIVIALGFDGVKVWNDMGEEVRKISSDYTSVLDFSLDGKLLGIQEKVIKIWDNNYNELYSINRSPNIWPTAKISGNGTVVLVANTTDGIRIWNNGQLKSEYNNHQTPKSIDLSYSGTTALVVYDDRVITYDQGENVGWKILPIRSPKAAALWSNTDGEKFAVAYEDSGYSRVSIVASNQNLTSPYEWKGVKSLQFSPDGEKILALLNFGALIGHVRTKPLEFPSWKFKSAAFSPDGTLIATTMFNSIHLWNANDLSLVASYEAEELQDIRAVEFSPDGTRILITSASMAKLLLIRWPVESLSGIHDFDAIIFIGLLYWARAHKQKIKKERWIANVIEAIAWNEMDASGKKLIQDLIKEVVPSVFTKSETSLIKK